MIESRTLAYFVCACQHHHLAQAAAELGVAPSTLTMALKSLEADIGLPLFNVSKVGHVPTPQGLRLFQSATRVLHGERFCRAHVADARDVVLDRVVIRHLFYFTLGVFSKAASRAIDRLQSQFPSTLMEPIWHTGDWEPRDLATATVITNRL
jgi:DNA-binding transcriptional LysR family regulator